MGMKPAIDITAEQRRTILALLNRYLPDTTAWAYGSRVKWTSRPESDLDLVVFARPEQGARVAALRKAFEESDLPFRVDLFVWDEVPESFKARIEGDHVVLTKDNPARKENKGSRWRRCRIDDVAEKVAMGPFGSSIKVETFTPSGVPIISGQHLHGSRVDDKPGFNFISEAHAERLRGANVRKGDIIFTHAGNIGQVACIPENSEYDRYVVSQRQFYMRPKPSETVPEFIVAYFKTPEGQHELLANASQVGVPSIARPVTYLRSIEIPTPPIQEQRDIAHILRTLDDKIELNHCMNETLEAMVRATFRDWFIDFGPTRAKMKSQKPYLSEPLWSLFPDRLIDATGLPENWESITFENYMKLAYGKSLPAKARRSGKVAVYGSGGFVDFHDEALINGPAVIVGRKGTIGSVYWEDRSVFPIDTVFYIIPKRSTLIFCYQILLTQPLGDMNTDAAVPGLNRANVYRLEFPWPGSELSRAYHELITPIWKRRSMILKEIEILSQTRNVLLLNLVSGKIRIPCISAENYDVE